MFALLPQARVYLASQPVDMRAGHNGLFAIIQKWGLDPFGGDRFAFIGKRGDRAKVLVWHRGGFVLLYPRAQIRSGGPGDCLPGLLLARDVLLYPVGRSWMVTLADVEENMPRVWESILKVEKERHSQNSSFDPTDRDRLPPPQRPLGRGSVSLPPSPPPGRAASWGTARKGGDGHLFEAPWAPLDHEHGAQVVFDNGPADVHSRRFERSDTRFDPHDTQIHLHDTQIHLHNMRFHLHNPRSRLHDGHVVEHDGRLGVHG